MPTNLFSKILLLLLVLLFSGYATSAQTKSYEGVGKGLGVGISDHRPPYLYYPSNIYYRITKKLDTITFHEPGFAYDGKRTEQKLRDLFGNGPIDLKMTVKPSGEIVDVVVESSSRTNGADEKAIAFVRSCGPYCSGNWFDTEKSFSVHFPWLAVSELKQPENK